MQTVLVNNTKLKVPAFASDNTITLLYAAENVGKGYLYSYSNIESEKPGVYTVTKLSDYLKDQNISITEFESRIISIMDLYPKLTELQVFFSYYQIQPSSIQNTLSKPGFLKTFKVTKIATKYEAWNASLKFEKEATAASAKKALEYYNLIKDYLPKTLPQFTAEAQSLKMYLSTMASTDIREVFHKILIRPQLPFVVLKYSGTITAHVHPELKIAESWLDAVQNTDKDGIIFFICHEAVPAGPLSFSQGFCDVNGNISIDVKITGGGGVSNVKKYFNFSMKAFGKDIKQSGGGSIKGTFEVTSLKPYNKLVFCDMLDTDTTFSKFVFVSDYQHFDKNKHSKLTSFTKERLMFYYGMFHGYNKKKCISAITTVSGSNYKIRVSKVKHISDAKEFIAVFTALLKIYDSKLETITKEYESYGIPQKFIADFQKVKIKVAKQNKKSNERLLALQKYDPIFSAGGIYAKDCESRRQPYIVEMKDYETKKKELEEMYKNVDTSKYLAKWTLPASGKEVYVGCAPNRNQNIPKFLPASGAPCCYAPPKKKDTEGKAAKTHVVNYSKLLEENQHGEIPFNFQSFAGREKIQRLGVSDKDFVLWCLGLAKEGSKDNVDIEKIKEGLKSENLELESTQSSFNIDSFGDELEEEIDATKFRRVLESYFKVNIIVLEINLENEHGVFAIENDNTFITPTRFQFEEVVVLTKITKLKRGDVKTQYNLVIKVLPKGLEQYKFKKDDPFVRELMKAYELTTKATLVGV